MIALIWVRDDETGILEDEFKDGDIHVIHPDSFEPSLGAQEKKSWLVVKIPDPPNLAKVQNDLTKSEYRSGESNNHPPVVAKKRLYRLEWRSRFDGSEIAVIEDAAQQLPDGTTSAGGTVTDGVLDGVFTAADFRKK